MTASRESIAAKIRALRAKTVENGCTEAEALAAAEMLAKLLARHNMTLDEAEMRETPFRREADQHTGWVGERLWKVAGAAAHMTSARYWSSPPGVHPVEINFFGFEHEVEVARYLVEICRTAMTREQDRILLGGRLRWQSTHRQRRAVAPFLDGMADRLDQRIRAMRPPEPTGTELVVLHGALVDQAMSDAGLKTKSRAAQPSRDLEAGYLRGRAAGDRVALNPGLRGSAVMGVLR